MLENYTGFHIQSQNFKILHFFLWKAWFVSWCYIHCCSNLCIESVRVNSTSMNIYLSIFIFTHDRSHLILFTVRVVCLNTKSQNIYFIICCQKFNIYIIQIFWLKKNYKQKRNARGLKSPFYVMDPWNTWWTQTTGFAYV